METLKKEVINRDLVVNRVLATCALLVLPRLFCARSVFDKKNVMHIERAILNTLSEQQQEYRALDTNSEEDRCYTQLMTLLMSMTGDNKDAPISKVVDIGLFNALMMRVDSPMQVRYASASLFALAVANQHDLVVPSVTIPAMYIHSSMHGDLVQFSFPEVYASCVFEPTDPIVNKPSRRWEVMYRSTRFIDEVGINDKAVFFMNSLSFPILPSVGSMVGLTKFTIDQIGNGLSRFLITSSPRNHYIDNHLLDYLSIGNRIAIDLAKVVASLEADDDAPIDDGGDEPTDDGGGEEPTDDGGDEPGNPDDPDSGKDNPSDDSDPVKPEHKALLKLDLELPKDETLDDFLYKISVARFISSLAADSTGSKTLTIRALMIWKNQYLFLVSVNETKKFLTKLKQKLN